ncbi:MAG: helix-turn-helix domain-containing protein [Clostridiales bacterium]|nr:helix-turn-helix domain-containing protein [Clostridiales bacterium]
MDINTAVSKNTKRIRERKKLTLDMAAKETGVSRSMLAQIERGDVNPTLSVLWKIATGYKVSFSSLIEQSHEQPTVLTARETVPILEDEGRFVNYPCFSFDDRRLFETYRIRIAPGGSLKAEAHLANTEEYLTVFSGELEVVAGGESFLLREGDSIRFRSDRPHAYANPGTLETTLSMIIYYDN